MAQRGNVDYGQLRQTARKGIGVQVQMFGGGLTTAGHVATFNANGDIIDGGAAAGGAGTVTSVDMTMPPEFTVSGNPITTAGTFAIAKASQAPNLVWASPPSGSGAPYFRALVAADIPAGVGQPQTPWQQNINAAGFTLSNIPSISASGGLAVSAGGTGNIGLNTNAKARLSIDSAGHVVIAQPDDGAAVFNATASQTVANFYAASNPRVQIVDQTSGSGILTLAVASAAGSWLGNSTAFDALIYNGLASGGVAFGTNGKARMRISGAGIIAVNQPDAAPGNVIAFTGAGSISVGTNLLSVNSLGALNLTSTGAIAVLTGAGGATRLTIDSAGHATLAVPDDTWGTGINAGAAPMSFRGNLFEAGYGTFAGAGLVGNIWYNGSSWLYRQNGYGGYYFTGNTTLAPGIFAVASGTAGGGATLVQHLRFDAGGGYTLAMQPSIFAITVNTSAYDGFMPNSSIEMQLVSNTQLVFRCKGSDGVVRQSTAITLA